MAKNYEEFREHGKQMVDYICDYIKSMDQRPVAPTIEPGYLVPLLAGNLVEVKNPVRNCTISSFLSPVVQMKCQKQRKVSKMSWKVLRNQLCQEFSTGIIQISSLILDQEMLIHRFLLTC